MSDDKIEANKKVAIVVFFVTSFIITQFSLRHVTKIARDHRLDEPLPDAFHKILPRELRKYHEYSDWVPLVPLLSFFLVDKFQHIWDFLLLVSIIYIIRAISFSLTVLPSPSTECKCEWEYEPETFLRKVLNFFYQEGCNDLIFSGHTSVMVLSSLFLCWYYFSGKYLAMSGILLYNIFGILVIIGTRLHYSVDTFIATVVCTLLFFLFHCRKI